MLRVVDQAARTDAGRQRHANEDSYYARAPIYAVADGMGGAQAGEVASRIAAEAFDERTDEGTPEQQLARVATEANRRIFDLAQEDSTRSGMGTTLTGLLVDGDEVAIVHVGDSRAYVFRDGELRQLTRDHSLVEAQVRAGLLDRESSRQSEEQNILLRVLGREPEVEVELNEVPVQPGDYLLLCSDGLTRMVPEPTLADAIFELRDPQRICKYLIDTANRNGGADNITVVVVEVPARWWRRIGKRWRRQAER